MAVNVAISGFGRIGRLVLRSIIESKRKDINVIAINDLAPIDANAFLLANDTVHGPLKEKISALKLPLKPFPVTNFLPLGNVPIPRL